jgi:hypothetical protein
MLGGFAMAKTKVAITLDSQTLRRVDRPGAKPLRRRLRLNSRKASASMRRDGRADHPALAEAVLLGA